MNTPDFRFRSYLKCGFCMLGLLCLPGCRSAQNPSKSRKVKLTNLSNVKEGITSFNAERVALIRRFDTLKAISLVCSHQTCLLRAEPGSGFICPCHGGEFDLLGRVKNGPPKTGLPFFEIEVSDQDFVSIDLAKQVSPEWSYKLKDTPV